jgi:YegS/Rv2252/BmrU family lipid kinase
MFTEGPGDAVSLTREALEDGWQQVVAVGGDGTLNEVLNGFFEFPGSNQRYELTDGWLDKKDECEPAPVASDAVLGFIPVGTGNDFRRSLGLSSEPLETAARILGQSTRPIDMGEVGFQAESVLDSRLFLNITSAGIGGIVDRIANSQWKGLGGRSSFLIAAIRAFQSWRNIPLEFSVDNDAVQASRIFNLIVANGQYYGGGMHAAPEALLDDGLFEIVSMGDLTKGEVLRLLPDLYRGTMTRHPKISHWRGSSLMVRSAKTSTDSPLDMDGETPGNLPAHFSMHRKAVPFKV